MTEPDPQNTYTQGYSASTTSSHELRTAATDAAFLLPHIRAADHILDVGCGPGTITLGLAAHAPRGRTTGIDLSSTVLSAARGRAAAAGLPTAGEGACVFEEANVLSGLPYADAAFDIVFASQLFPHLPPPDLPEAALAEMRRVLKPGGILATRDAAELHFYPKRFGLGRLWAGYMTRVLGRGRPDAELPGGEMPALFRRVGFEAGKIHVGAGTTVFAGQDARKWYAESHLGRLSEGDEFLRSWVEGGVSEGEIEETRDALRRWGECEDGWYAALQCEIYAYK